MYNTHTLEDHTHLAHGDGGEEEDIHKDDSHISSGYAPSSMRVCGIGSPCIIGKWAWPAVVQ